ncbi:response regulator transcription factor [Cryobacterium sp. CG_9.6]|uniref:response regulator transcription factor n=1 Tax=Cryobacterium sp. CG_9.6 TaxID=2760710 RepID=UPI0024759D5B|nr:response regulator transcription factor [Cryobacterium sp. CG_9.6]MDH6238526.1 DNA-binding response OmpR family regulator [Cryobacterium sp. CG_9.6]
MRILVVDDEFEMAGLINRGLTAEGHDVVEAHDGIVAISAARAAGFDLAVVDVMMPGMSGFELTRRLKALDSTTAVILLTARDAVDDRVRGLDSGADDYLTKPFAFAELSARIRAVRRRDALNLPAEIDIGALTIDLARHRAHTAAGELPLSRTEFDVLRVLALSGGATVTRATIIEQVWESSTHIDPNIVDQYVSYLRRKLDHREAGVRIMTVRGIGFGLTAMDP